MADVKFTLLPHIRQGLSGLIADPDHHVDPESTTTNIAKARPTITVKIAAKGVKVADGEEEILTFGSNSEYEREASIYGPGDIIGIGAESIVRTDPLDWNTNFEPNYLPYVEFWDEDFPWRYTPLAPAGSIAVSPEEPEPEDTWKLRPWVTLVVLKEDEFSKVDEFNGVLPRIKISDAVEDYNTIFPDDKSLWAWAHVHINDELTGSDVPAKLDQLKTKLENDPAIAVSRLLCPRRLQENTGYYCFLIPTFESGRLAGLGQFDEGSANLLQPAWEWGEDPEQAEFPYYYEWFFKTGKYGDFESLVNLLQPIVLDPEIIGSREMEIQTLINDDFVEVPEEVFTVPLGGALRPVMEEIPDDIWWMEDPPNDEPAAYKTAIANELNKSGEYLITAPTSDPVITAPLYGRWHAKTNELDPELTNWIHKINLDPKLRAIAGAGADAVKKNQELFMQIAWEQVKDVEEANRLLQKLILALRALQSAHNRNYSNLSDEKKLLLASDVMPRVIGEDDLTVYQNAMDSKIPNGCFTGDFKKMIRTNGTVAKNFSESGSLGASELISGLNDGTIEVASLYSSPGGQNTYNILQESFISSSFSQSVNTRDLFALTIPSSNFFFPGGGTPDSSMADKFRDAVSSFHDGLAFAWPEISARPSLDIVAAAEAVSTAIEPDTAMLAVANKAVATRTPSGALEALTALASVMVCPKIEKPVFDYLYEVSPDFVIPNMNGLPQNSVSLMELNREAIEAFMVGMNHEMASELLWREYPTDQRGTVFSRFWAAPISGPDAEDYNKTRIIKPIHLWTNTEGNALSNLGVNNPEEFSPENVLILAVRGELLKKYPNTLIYAQKAKWQLDEEEEIDLTLPRVPDPDFDDERLLPIFQAKASDIVFFGFDLAKDDAKGYEFPEEPEQNPDPGYYFVFKEMIGETHYGLDEFDENEPIKDPGDLENIDFLNWGHMGDDVEYIDFVNPSIAFSLITTDIWNKNSANMTNALLRRPAYICIHAKELLQ